MMIIKKFGQKARRREGGHILDCLYHICIQGASLEGEGVLSEKVGVVTRHSAFSVDKSQDLKVPYVLCFTCREIVVRRFGQIVSKLDYFQNMNTNRENSEDI